MRLRQSSHETGVSENGSNPLKTNHNLSGRWPSVLLLRAEVREHNPRNAIVAALLDS